MGFRGMDEIKLLARKTIDTLKYQGPLMLVKKAKSYIKYKRNGSPNVCAPEKTFSDVLFINGCALPHPPRYRVTHQREQLWAGDVSNNEVFYTELTLQLVRLYRVFIFYRCPFTDTIGKFIEEAKANNKVVLYDIDDLLIDRSYTTSIKYLETMGEEERNSYYHGIDLNQKTLKMCDGAITTTERMAEELGKYVPSVYINRNVASEEMLQLSEKAVLNVEEKKDDKIRIGYFSGSITHNDDFKMILPILVNLMDRYGNLVLVVVGDLDLPKELDRFKDRIENQPFGSWKKLPDMIARVDINIAPLESNIFNEAKSENKWVEAALVKVPTVASNLGAFARMIQNGETGFLCSTGAEWERVLSNLIEDENIRKRIGENSYAFCKKNCTSVYTAFRFADYIRSVMNRNIAFITPMLQLSGGMNVILKHCVILKKAGYDVTLINQGCESYKQIDKDGVMLNVVSYNDISIGATFDKVVATLWTTTKFLEIYAKIKQRFYLVQGFETDFGKAGDPSRMAANRTYCLSFPIEYITISKWCQNWLKKEYSKSANYAPNGISSTRFYPQKRDWKGRKVRILVEGNSKDYYKNIDESFKIVDLLDKEKFEIWFMSYLGEPKENYYVDKFLHKVPYEEVPTVYRQCDILIKSSILESFSYPPLEMMATGGYVVVAPNDGNVEYLRDGKNCLFYRRENLSTAVEAIERIVTDENLRNTLYKNGINTAKERDWDNIEEDILNLYIV